MSRTQYFYNIFTINHTWLIIISSKNLWQINCDNGIAENVKKKKKNCFGNCGNPIAENVKKKKKNYFGNCGNAIAENGKKKLWNLWMSKKKKSCHIHNIFTINHTWLIIISSKNLWQINCSNGTVENVKKKKNCFGNCGNAIAENVKKKKKNGNCGNPIAENVKKKKKIYIYIYIYIFWQFRQWDCHNCQIFFFFFTFSAMPLPQLICHKFFELIIINHVWFIVKIL